MNRFVLCGILFHALLVPASQRIYAESPVTVIFDTDIGNDCDDVLALGMLHSLQSRGECQLAAVTITKDHPLAASFVDAVNTFYGRGNIPIGICQSGVTPEQGKFIGLANQLDNDKLRYPHDLRGENQAADAVDVLRKVLTKAEDHSVVIIQVGFSTNLANLLASPGDQNSPLTGGELVEKKVKRISIMAGAFKKIPSGGKLTDHREYNVIKDIPSATKLASQWPTEIIWSGFEIGLALPYPHQSIENDFRYVPHHPLAEAYVLYNPPPHDRPTWDLTSVLFAVRPEHEYFGLSERGTVQVLADGLTVFNPDTAGKHRYLVLEEGHEDRILEALQLLSSEPPHAGAPVLRENAP